MVEQWFFNIFLHDPLQIWRLTLQVLSDLFKAIENLNTLPLIQIRRF